MGRWEQGNGLRVAHISPARGGVSNAARRLHQGLRQAGVDSKLYVSEVRAGEAAEAIYPFPTSSGLLAYADSASKIIHKKFGLDGLTHVSSRYWQFPDADIIHLHGAGAGWFNLGALRGLGRRHGLAWTMHDKHLGTGGCGYPEAWNSDNWRTGCGNCPKAKHDGWLLDTTRYTFRQKQAIFKDVRMAVVAPNQWMYDFIAESAITRDQILRKIPYGIDTDVFRPTPMAEARRELGLPEDARLLLSVASKLGQPRKGLQYYPALLEHLRKCNPDKNLGLLLVGDQLPDAMVAELKRYVPVYALGHIQDMTRLATVYSAADLFVITSTIDNFPNVVLESLACGTPAAGFRVGGIPDMIVPGETGILVELGDMEAMAAGITELLNDESRLKGMKAACRARAEAEYSLGVQAGRYVALYRELVKS